MELIKVIVKIILLSTANCFVVNINKTNNKELIKANNQKDGTNDTIVVFNDNSHNIDAKLNEVFKDVYTDCVLQFSYSCLQKKTLLYLEELNNMSEVSVIGDYVKFVKLNTTTDNEVAANVKLKLENGSEELGSLIDDAIDKFFNSHIIKFSALGKYLTIPRNVEEFEGRKKRKGGGGGGHHDDDGGKKKMMMMAMTCMKMKFMMMVPAMMGMMGMMSFKGMMFSMMSFMISKMMLLMKLLEKKSGTALGGSSVGSDGGWAAGGGSGAWMPAGGQDVSGGGYDANAQWQSRSILEKLEGKTKEPVITYVIPAVRYINSNKKVAVDGVQRVDHFGIPKRRKRDIDDVKDNDKNNHVHYNDEIMTNNNYKFRDFNEISGKLNLTEKVCDIVSEILRVYLIYVKENNFSSHSNSDKDDTLVINQNLETNSNSDEGNSKYESGNPKSRSKRGILDIVQSSYIYWMNKLLGTGDNRRNYVNPKFKMINGVKYVYYPLRPALKTKTPKDAQTSNRIKTIDEGFKPIIAAEDFNKGEILEVGESRMNKKRFHKMKNTVNDTMDDNPWE